MFFSAAKQSLLIIITRSGKPKLIYSVTSQFKFFLFYKTVKVYIFLVLRSSRFQISNFVGLRLLWEFPAKKLCQGSTLSRHFGLKLLLPVAQIQSPFLLFHGLHDENVFFSFFIKIEGVTVPVHFLQNGGCDVI